MYSCIVGWVDVGLSTKVRKRYVAPHAKARKNSIKTVLCNDFLGSFAA
jgi:hypothetical protein